MTKLLLFSMISIGYTFTRELTTKSLHSFSSLSWVMHRHICPSPALHSFLLGAGSDQQPGAPSSNHMNYDTMDGRFIDVVDPQIWNKLPPRLPALIQPDFRIFTPSSKPSSSEKASLYISGLEVLLNIRHSNQTVSLSFSISVVHRHPLEYLQIE